MSVQKPVTLDEIAVRAGVSKAVVSRALNRRPGVGEKTRARVRQIAAELGYRPFLAVRQEGMYAAASPSLAFVFLNTVSGEIWRHIRQGIDEAMKNTAYLPAFLTFDPAELRTREGRAVLIDRLRNDGRFKGVLIFHSRLDGATIESLGEAGLPVVTAGVRTEFGRRVWIDERQAAADAVRKFVELGRRRIGIISPDPAHDRVWDDRYQGYCQALLEAGLSIEPTRFASEPDCWPPSAARATARLLERHPDTDAILYGSSIQAMGGLRAMRELGRRCPEEIAVIGFDEVPYAAATAPSLSTVDSPFDELGRQAALMLRRVIESPATTGKDEEEILRSKLNLRGSCGEQFDENPWTGNVL